MADGVTMGGGMLIPQNLDAKQKEQLLENFDELIDYVSEGNRVRLEELKATEDTKERIKQENERKEKADEQLRKILTPKTSIGKMQEKLTKTYHKWLVKKNFFKNVGNWLKTLAENAGGWLMNLLKLLFVLAIFDPKGVFLKSILNFITKMVVQFINIIIERLPGIIKTMWNIFWDVLVPGFANMGKAIGEAIFGADSILSKIFEAIGGLIPIVVVAMGLFTKLSAVLATLGITAGATLGWLIAIPVALMVLWKYSEQIMKFLNTFPKFLEKKLGVVGKILGTLFKVITGPLKFIVWVIQIIKKYGFKKLLKMITKFFKELGTKIKNAILGYVSFLLLPFKTIFNFVTNTIPNAISRIWKEGWSYIKTIPERILNMFLDMVGSLGDYISVYLNPKNFIGKTEAQRKAMVEARTIVRQAEEIAETSGNAKVRKEYRALAQLDVDELAKKIAINQAPITAEKVEKKLSETREIQYSRKQAKDVDTSAPKPGNTR